MTKNENKISADEATALEFTRGKEAWRGENVVKDCPFCGGAAGAVDSWYHENWKEINCAECTAKISAEFEREAIVEWNRRASDTELEDLRRKVQAYEEMLREANNIHFSCGVVLQKTDGTWLAETDWGATLKTIFGTAAEAFDALKEVEREENKK